jgi:integrase
MSVFKREGSPFYQYEFVLQGNRFRGSTKVASRREAESVEKALREEARKKLAEAPQTPALTMDQALGRYWKEQGHKKAPSWAKEIDRYSRDILRIIPPAKLITDIDDSDINDFVQGRIAEGGGKFAINRALAVWRRVHNVARKNWKQKVQVIDWAEHMTGEVERVRFLTEDEIKALLDHLSPALGLAVEWSIYTGCRREETFGLTWGNVFFDRGYATVIAKGGNEHRVWLSPNALDVLSRCEQGGRYVFNTTNWKKLWYGAMKRAGVEDFRWHDLRHTHATWLRQLGIPVEVVQRSLGHKKVSTTMRYAHVDDRELQEALHKIPAVRPHKTGIVSLFAGKTKA